MITEDRTARLRRRRRALERVVEKALERLDRLDGDPDLEPSLGASEHPSHWTARDFAWTDYANRRDPPQPAADDREEDADLEPDAHAEPSLGSLGLHENCDQRSWSNGGTDDLEGCEHDGREPDVDAEPDSDAEPDFDGEGTPNPAWTINGRDHSRAHGCDADPLCLPETQRSSLAAFSRSGLSDTGQAPEGRHASPLSRCVAVLVVDPDDTPDTITGPCPERGMGGPL